MKLTTTRRWLSSGFVAIYWLALPVLALSVLGIVLAWATAKDQFSVRGMPDWLVFVAFAVLPVAVIWRLLVHHRARKAAEAAAASGLENNND